MDAFVFYAKDLQFGYGEGAAARVSTDTHAFACRVAVESAGVGGAEEAFARLNRGSGREAPELGALELRSMSVGDVVLVPLAAPDRGEDGYFICLPSGWAAVPAPAMQGLLIAAIRELLWKRL